MSDSTKNRLKKKAVEFTATRAKGLYSSILQMTRLCQQSSEAALHQEPAVPLGDVVATTSSVKSLDRFQTRICSTP